LGGIVPAESPSNVRPAETHYDDDGFRKVA
jgi:hypothetical protein